MVAAAARGLADRRPHAQLQALFPCDENFPELPSGQFRVCGTGGHRAARRTARPDRCDPGSLVLIAVPVR